MADGVTVRHNLPEFTAQLKALGQDFDRKIVRAGVRAAATIFKKRAEQLAPVSHLHRKGRISGTLKRNIRIVRAKDSRAGKEHQYVGVRSGGRQPKGAPPATRFLPFYWRWVEEGHRIVKRGAAAGGGSRTRALRRARFDAAGGGRTQPAWFLRNAFLSVKDQALDAFNKRIQDRIDKENAKRA